MPERKDDYFVREHVVVNVVADAIELETTQFGILGRGAALTYARLKRQEFCGRLEVVCDRSQRCWPIGGPPLCCSLKLSQRPRRDFNGSHGRQWVRSLRRTSETAIVSPRRDWAMDSSSSCSSSGGTTNVPSPSGASTVTTVPSGKASPSRTTLPLTTVPVASFMARSYTSTPWIGFPTPNVGVQRLPKAVRWNEWLGLQFRQPNAARYAI